MTQGAVRELLIEDELKESYLRYAMSVIVSRALPDARDGLKPSQRRIHVAMNDLGLGPRAKFRKCAKICGDTSGNYHPHGEQVVYPTLVRMAQPFNMRYPLVEGQGNFGSIDGDPPAAMRYTEARMTAIAMELLEDLDRDTVDFVANYDGSRQEPAVLPGKFPNLICNGAAGIAVGMASQIPPHNLGEIAGAIRAVIENPDLTTDELMQIVPGPDFPTGGVICGRRGIRDAYETGRGAFVVRARAHVETGRQNRPQIVVTEIPYQVNKARVIERIAELVKEDRLEGVHDIRDESSTDIRLVIELKRAEDPDVFLNRLYKFTQLQDSYSVMNIALVDGRPETLPLREMLLQYVEHRKEVVRRRTAFLLRRAQERIHIVEGLLRALDVIDEVIETIRGSADVEAARAALVDRMGFSVAQANAILGMRLQQLTGLERGKLDEERRALAEQIREYTAILGDERLVLQIIVEDVEELREKYGDPRRTEISDEEVDFDVADLVASEDVVVTITHAGYVKRTPLSVYRQQQRGGKGVIGADAREGDFVEHLFIANTHDSLLFFTERGKVHLERVSDLPSLDRASRGRAIANFLTLAPGEKIAAMLPIRTFAEGDVVVATERGLVKKTPLRAYENVHRGGIIGTGLREGDRVIGAAVISRGREIVLGTSAGMAIRFSEAEVRSMGRPATGVRGIALRPGDRVVGMALVDEGGTLLTVCANGYGKRTPVAEYRPQRRGGLGLKNLSTTERNGDVIGVRSVTDDDDVVLISVAGKVIRMPVSDIRPIGRNTQGVRVISLDEGDRLVTVARAEREENGEPRASAPPSAAPAAPPPRIAAEEAEEDAEPTTTEDGDDEE